MYRLLISLILTASCPVNAFRQNRGFPARKLNDDSAVSVMTWNILARPYTKYNSKFHRNIKGEQEELEALEQTKGRYRIAAEKIVELSRDLVFLQESDLDF